MAGGVITYEQLWLALSDPRLPARLRRQVIEWACAPGQPGAQLRRGLAASADPTDGFAGVQAVVAAVRTDAKRRDLLLRSLIRGGARSNPLFARVGPPLSQIPPPRQDAVRRRMQGLIIGRFAELALLAQVRAQLIDGKIVDVAAEHSQRDVLIDAYGEQMSINVKAFAEPFRQAAKYVSVAPEHCAAIATYKLLGPRDTDAPPALALLLLHERATPLVARFFQRLGPAGRAVFDLLAVSNPSCRKLIEDALIGHAVDAHFEALMGAAGYHAVAEIPFHFIALAEAERLFLTRPERAPGVYRSGTSQTQPNMHLDVSTDTVPLGEALAALGSPARRPSLMAALRADYTPPTKIFF